MHAYPAPAFSTGDQAAVKLPGWFGVPAEPARITDRSWSVDFGQWSYRLEWLTYLCWFCQSDLKPVNTEE